MKEEKKCDCSACAGESEELKKNKEIIGKMYQMMEDAGITGMILADLSGEVAFWVNQCSATQTLGLLEFAKINAQKKMFD